MYSNQSKKSKRHVQKDRKRHLKNLLKREIQIEWEKDEARGIFWRKVALGLGIALVAESLVLTALLFTV